MSSHPTYWQNDRNPSLADVLTSGGVAVDLSTATVTFKMRGPLDGGNTNATVKVNSAVSAKDASGNWRYDWAAADLDTAGMYLCWLEVTISGKTQTLWESIIEVRAHSAAHLYIELEEAKSTFELTGLTFADLDVQRAVNAASRAIDDAVGGNRRFYLDANATSVRYYTPDSQYLLDIDDLVTLTSLKVDRTADGVFEETWTVGTDFVMEPFNHPTDGWPWERVRVRRQSGRWFPCEVDKSVEVTGKFGWPAVPEPIKTATSILVARLVKRMREAPLGVMPGGLDNVGIRIARTDPDIQQLIARYTKAVPFI